MRVIRGMIDLEVPLPFNIYKGDGSLLMRQGVVSYNQSRIDQLCQWETYTTANGEKDDAPAASIVTKADDVTVTDYIEDLMFRLDITYSNFLTNGFNVVNDVTRISVELYHKMISDPDAMIGMVHLRTDLKHSIIRTLQNAVFSILTANSLGWSKQRVTKLASAALTENLGMLSMQEDLFRHSGPLQEWQTEAIRKHPATSVQMLIGMGVKDKDWLRAVGYHHERMDGSGYPNKQQGSAIFEESRVLAIAVRYGATISPRMDRKPGSPQDVMRYLLKGEKEQYDQDIVRHFIAEIGVYPPGITVRLKNGDIAVVTHRRAKRTFPLVSSIWDRELVPYDFPVERDTYFSEFAILGHFLHDDASRLNEDALWGKERHRLGKDIQMFRVHDEYHTTSAEDAELSGEVTLF